MVVVRANGANSCSFIVMDHLAAAFGTLGILLLGDGAVPAARTAPIGVGARAQVHRSAEAPVVGPLHDVEACR